MSSYPSCTQTTLLSTLIHCLIRVQNSCQLICRALKHKMDNSAENVHTSASQDEGFDIIGPAKC